MPLDEYFLAEKESELIIQNNFDLQSMATQKAIANIVNQIFGNQEGGENNDRSI